MANRAEGMGKFLHSHCLGQIFSNPWVVRGRLEGHFEAEVMVIFTLGSGALVNCNFNVDV